MYQKTSLVSLVAPKTVTTLLQLTDFIYVLNKEIP